MYDLDDDDPFGPAKVEINHLNEPSGPCAWDQGYSAPATHNVTQYDAATLEDVVDGGVDANYCEAHAVAMKARLEEWE